MAFDLDRWLEEQARQNPQYMQRQPDMTFTVDQAENAPDMTFGLAEAERQPAPFKPDMTFAPQWIETRDPGSYMSFLPEQTEPQPFKPDMTISLEEAERNRAPQPMSAGGPSPRGALASLLPQRDAEMDSRWRAAEQNALDRSGYAGNQSYGVGEAVRDFAPLAVGGVLDVLLNKGRGLGYLSGAAMQANAQTAANRQKEAQAAGDFAQQARQQREQRGNPELDAAYKQAQIENWAQQRQLGWENLNQRDLRQQALEAQRRLENDPNDPQAIALAEQIYRQSGGTIDVRGQLGAKNQGRVMPMARNVQELYLAEPKAAAAAQGRIGTELAMEPQTTAAAAREAAAVKGATVTAGTQAEREMGATTPVANAEVGDPGVWGALNDAQRTKGLAAAEARAVFAKALSTMQEIADRNGSQNLPSADKAAYDAAHGAALGQLSNLYHTGVINELEYQRMADRLPKSGGVKATATDLYGQISGQPKLLGDIVRGSGGETLSELETTMSQYGLRAPRQPSAAAPAPGGASVAAGDNLGVTGRPGMRNTPPIPQQPGAIYRATPGGGAATARSGAMGQVGGMSSGSTGGGGTVRMVDPEGEEGDVPADQVEQATRLGYRRVQ